MASLPATDVHQLINRATLPLAASLVTALEAGFGHRFSTFIGRYWPKLTPEWATIITLGLSIVLGLLLAVTFSLVVAAILQRLLWGTPTDRQIHQQCCSLIEHFEADLADQYCKLHTSSADEDEAAALDKLYAALSRQIGVPLQELPLTLKRFIFYSRGDERPFYFQKNKILQPMHAIRKKQFQKKLVLVLEYYNFLRIPYALFRDHGSCLRRLYRYAALPKDYHDLIRLIERSPSRFQKKAVVLKKGHSPRSRKRKPPLKQSNGSNTKAKPVDREKTVRDRHAPS